MALRTALLLQDRNFVGREYLAALEAAGRRPDLVIAAGRMSEASIARERERTGGLWQPPEPPAGMVVHRFERLDDPALDALLRGASVDVAIQGGVGILKAPLLEAPAIGFLNVHPGRLPQYRGNSCPEWAVRYGEPVVATAHLIDAGIDTGPVICSAPYTPPEGGYAAFRAGLYRHCAAVLLAALERLERDGAAAARPQDEAGARYWPPIPEEDLAVVRERLAA